MGPEEIKQAREIIANIAKEPGKFIAAARNPGGWGDTINAYENACIQVVQEARRRVEAEQERDRLAEELRGVLLVGATGMLEQLDKLRASTAREAGLVEALSGCIKGWEVGEDIAAPMARARAALAKLQAAEGGDLK